MANKTLFQRLFGKAIPNTDAINFECAPAYKLSPKQSLAQYAATACFNNTFYADADFQLNGVLDACAAVESEFIARTAVYARRHSFMKDMPALLCAVLASRDLGLHEAVFEKVIDDTKMLRNYVQIVRPAASGGSLWALRRNELSVVGSTCVTRNLFFDRARVRIHLCRTS